VPNLKDTLRDLRELCSPFNIYTFSALETVVHMGDGLTQQEIGDITKQHKQGVGRWEVWMEINGIVNRTEEGRRRHLTYTASGTEFITKLTSLLCP